jgi:hypothetical protein
MIQTLLDISENFITLCRNSTISDSIIGQVDRLLACSFVLADKSSEYDYLLREVVLTIRYLNLCGPSELILKDLSNYNNVLSSLIMDESSLKPILDILEYRRNACGRWCYLRDKKCVPVLAFSNGCLVEDYVPE